jgi:hypothetical protein
MKTDPAASRNPMHHPRSTEGSKWGGWGCARRPSWPPHTGRDSPTAPQLVLPGSSSNLLVETRSRSLHLVRVNLARLARASSTARDGGRGRRLYDLRHSRA